MNDWAAELGHSRTASERLRFGEFELQLSPLALLHNGRQIKLQRQPLKLLALLAMHRGAVVTHDDIRALLWPGRTVDFAGGTHVCIRHIRTALGDDGAHPLIIENVSGTGYRFLPRIEEMAASRRNFPHYSWAAGVAAMLALLLVAALAIGNPFAGPDRSAAFDAYARGQFLLDQSEPEMLRRSIGYFERAAAVDPDYAPAFVGAAQAHLGLDEFAEAERWARDALARDDSLAEAHLVLGEAALRGRWHWRAAEAHFASALAADGGLARAYQGLAVVALARGRSAEALRHMGEARRLDPGSTLVHADHGWMELAAGHPGRAAELCSEALDLAPSSLDARICLVRALSASGRHEDAVSHAVAVMSSSSASAEEIAVVAAAREGAARAFERWRLERYLRPGRAEAASAVLLADLHAFLGESDAALDLLERSADERLPSAPLVAIGPAFAALADEPRYRRLLARMGVVRPHQGI